MKQDLVEIGFIGTKHDVYGLAGIKIWPEINHQHAQRQDPQNP